MSDASHEADYWTINDRHITEAEERIRILKERIAELETAGLDTEQPSKSLVLFTRALAVMHEHRKQILDRLPKQE